MVRRGSLGVVVPSNVEVLRPCGLRVIYLASNVFLPITLLRRHVLGVLFPIGFSYRGQRFLFSLFFMRGGVGTPRVGRVVVYRIILGRLQCNGFFISRVLALKGPSVFRHVHRIFRGYVFNDNEGQLSTGYAKASVFFHSL